MKPKVCLLCNHKSKCKFDILPTAKVYFKHYTSCPYYQYFEKNKIAKAEKVKQ